MVKEAPEETGGIGTLCLVLNKTFPASLTLFSGPSPLMTPKQRISHFNPTLLLVLTVSLPPADF